jgi:hypothetical protein
MQHTFVLGIEEDVQTWMDLGAKLKPQVPPRDNLKVITTSGGRNEK